MNYSEQASAAMRMYRERLQSIVEASGASCKSPLAASWILDSLSNTDSKLSNKTLTENWKLTYMITRLTEYHWVDRDDLPHQFTYATRARLLVVGYHSKQFNVSDFERMLANTADKLKRS